MICLWCSKQPFHWDGSYEYPQHMFWSRNKKKGFCYNRHKKFSPRSGPTKSGSIITHSLTLIVFQKNFLKNLILEIQQVTKKRAKLPSMQWVNTSDYCWQQDVLGKGHYRLVYHCITGWKDEWSGTVRIVSLIYTKLIVTVNDYAPFLKGLNFK